ncbi:MAG TPA: HlyD family secretion protein [Ginsengibacter sp.]
MESKDNEKVTPANSLPSEETNGTNAEPKKKSKVFLIILIVMIILGGWFGISKYTYAMHHEETDDAQVQADISPVIPRVSGYVNEVRVKDNQAVHKGDTLLVLDNRDYKLNLDRAEAALVTAESNVDAARATSNAARTGIESSKASVSTVDAQIAAAQIAVTRTTQDYTRYANLIQDHSITQQQYEEAQAAKETAEKQLQILEQQKKQASTQTSVVSSQSNATSRQIGVAESMVKQREVEVEDAKLNLSYTIITAAEDGKVSKVNVQEGQFLQAGQPVFSVVHNTNIWVVANFKETQYKKMKVGQQVIIHADAFPKHDFQATLSSFSPATGAEFALLPPDNASGNFVKVVQRLPVKIEFTDKSDTLLNRLKAGMNVDVDVHLN